MLFLLSSQQFHSTEVSVELLKYSTSYAASYILFSYLLQIYDKQKLYVIMSLTYSSGIKYDQYILSVPCPKLNSIAF